MKTIPFLSTFFRSVYDLTVYAEIASVRARFGILYFCILTTATALLLSSFTIVKLARGLELTRSAVAAKELPTFENRDGLITSRDPKPWKYQDKEFTFLVDTSGHVTEPAPGLTNFVLVTDRKVFIHENRRGQEQRRTLEAAQLPNFSFSKANVLRWLDSARLFLVPGITVFMVVSRIAIEAAIVVFFMLVALGLASLKDAPIDWGGALNIAIVSSSPAALLTIGSWVLHCGTLMSFLSAMVLQGIYVAIAINRCARPAVMELSSSLLGPNVATEAVSDSVIEP